MKKRFRGFQALLKICTQKNKKKTNKKQKGRKIDQKSRKLMISLECSLIISQNQPKNRNILNEPNLFNIQQNYKSQILLKYKFSNFYLEKCSQNYLHFSFYRSFFYSKRRKRSRTRNRRKSYKKPYRKNSKVSSVLTFEIISNF